MKTSLCIVLDLDDTLYLERDYVRSGFRAVGEMVRTRYGVDTFATVALREFESGRRGDIFNAAAAMCGCPATEANIQDMVQTYRRHRPEIQLLPDAREFLEFWRPRAKMALITDGPLDSQRRKLEALGLCGFFDVTLLTSEFAGAAKPSPRAFKMVEERCGEAGMKFLYVADNPVKDFEAPLALGWGTVRVRRDHGIYRDREAAPGVAPQTEVPDLTTMLVDLAQYWRNTQE